MLQQSAKIFMKESKNHYLVDIDTFFDTYQATFMSVFIGRRHMQKQQNIENFCGLS